MISTSVEMFRIESRELIIVDLRGLGVQVNESLVCRPGDHLFTNMGDVLLRLNETWGLRN